MQPFRVTHQVTAQTAFTAMEAAGVAAREIGVPVSVAVVDAHLSLIGFLRGNGATAHSIETSRRKAAAAASTGKATGWMNPDLALTLPMASGNLLTNVPGGFPLRYGGVLVGAIGIAGGTIEQDALIAKKTIDMIGGDSLE